ncbi:hypothetical protein BS50DRAFT_280468 [Corynespora cassiicola Philippines]|uniref:Uncharacterized protein n=1 Tax=Corynespora cassiicola Philippines TaxID=1448308 RepID=A0A2T2P121_CORCC|nr:hypothetical protein BS50DRAFT_280468 [Corynespora cassiicola Philippines]
MKPPERVLSSNVLPENTWHSARAPRSPSVTTVLPPAQALAHTPSSSRMTSPEEHGQNLNATASGHTWAILSLFLIRCCLPRPAVESFWPSCSLFRRHLIHDRRADALFDYLFWDLHSAYMPLSSNSARPARVATRLHAPVECPVILLPH